MKGYSKMKNIHSPHSRSMEVSDHLKSFEQHTDSKKIAGEESPESQERGNDEGGRKIKNHQNSKNEDDSFGGYSEEEEEEEESKEISNEDSRSKLKRNSSVSSASSSFHYAVKKAFSLRRSTSVSDRYCRIHDQSSTLPSPTQHHGDVDADGFVNNNSRSTKTKRTRSRILKACKRLFGM